MHRFIKTCTLTVAALGFMTSGALADWDRGHHRGDRGRHDGWHNRGGHWQDKHVRRNDHHSSIRFNFFSSPYPVYSPLPVTYYAPQPQQQIVFLQNRPVFQYNDHWGNARYCREYQSKSFVNGYLQQTYGQACRQPDGSWQIVN